jgi:hypothetical protein
MNANVGSIDKIVRFILGAALLSLVFLIQGPERWLGLTGIILLGTGLISWCPIYFLFGINTCAKK